MSAALQTRAIGVSLGGTAVLQLAGARLSAGAVAAACDAPGQSMDCGWFDAAGVSLHDVATGPLEGPLQEGRVALEGVPGELGRDAINAAYFGTETA